MSFILVGNYGAGNIGDDALFEYFDSAFRDTHLQIVSSSQNHESLPRLPFGFRSFFRPWWKTLSAIARSEGVIYGGGTLFTDTESVSACMMWWLYSAVARLCGRPIFLAFQGVGPFRTRFGEWLARSVYEHAIFISVRDAESRERVLRWRLCVPPILTFDPAFIRFQKQDKRLSTSRVLTLIPRHTSAEEYTRACLQALSEGSWDRIDIVLMDPSPAEYRIAKNIVSLPQAHGARIIPVHSVTEFLDTLSDSHFMVAERFHGLLAATALRIPFRLVSKHSGDKFSTLGRFRDPSSTDTAELVDLVETGALALRTALQNCL